MFLLKNKQRFYSVTQAVRHIKQAVAFLKNRTFKTEHGVPVLPNKTDNTLTIQAATTNDNQAIYAYRDTTIVGKLNIKAYDYKEVKVHLVRINKDNRTLDLGKIENGVNDIWQQAVVRYTFDELDPITITYADGEKFVHGGKGTFQNYNQDQKTAIQALPTTTDPNDYYLFFVDCYDRLDTAGIKSNEPVSGYMPVGRHYGFIYNEFNNTRTIFHELGHCQGLSHMAEDTSSDAQQKSTNLMGYGNGLNIFNWQIEIIKSKENK